ncbi:putative sodium-coupled neutral amino acid transporter 10 isoform X2 [Protopterus annectens]|uniref:putative sodium-coupled neutral amino acid transporter 10 isoform X2 n=1 Tax=Protopterus annectens TaxID=7888 RepID=UPI001CFB6453|nr:putative sodium-coupled neutral amino acid transporter 10 isoform X2 [Protopterus annectens]
MTAGDMRATVTFINSIVGVSVLTLPYCYKQCGVILGTVLLLFCAWLTYQSSMMLVKTAVANKRKTYFGLAKLSYGGAGKLVAELSVIGLLFGTCVTFHVVMEDLAAMLLESLTGFKVSQTQRIGLLFVICTFVVLPLSLRKNVTDSVLWSFIALTCYVLFVCVLFILCCHHLISNSWKIGKIALWHWEGLLKSLPIFTATFSCHPQILPLFFHQSVESVEGMSGTSKSALSITAAFYTLKPDGTFSVSGDLPLRYHFVATVLLVFFSMIIGLIVPDVETVLGLMGTTTVAITCYILPSLMHSKLSKGRFSTQSASEELPYRASLKEKADQDTEATTGRENVTEMMLLTVGILLLLSSTYSGISSELPEEINIQPIRKFLAVPDSEVENSIAKRNVENSLDNRSYMTPDFGLRSINGYAENQVMNNVVVKRDTYSSELQGNAVEYKPQETTAIGSNIETEDVQSNSHLIALKEMSDVLTASEFTAEKIISKLTDNDQLKTQPVTSSGSAKETEMVANNRLKEMQMEKSGLKNNGTTVRNKTVDKLR